MLVEPRELVYSKLPLRRRLRSSKTKFAAGPPVWNDLPTNILDEAKTKVAGRNGSQFSFRKHVTDTA